MIVIPSITDDSTIKNKSTNFSIRNSLWQRCVKYTWLSDQFQTGWDCTTGYSINILQTKVVDAPLSGRIELENLSDRFSKPYFPIFLGNKVPNEREVYYGRSDIFKVRRRVKFCSEKAKEDERRMRDEWRLFDSEKKRKRRDVTVFGILLYFLF